MKTIKTITITISLLFLSNMLLAENNEFKGDTIRYRFDKMLIEVVGTNYAANSLENIQISDQIKQVAKVLSTMTIEDTEEDEMLTILLHNLENNFKELNYKEFKLFRTKKDAKNLIVLNDGTLFEKEFGVYCIVLLNNKLEIKIYVADLEDLNYADTEEFRNKANNGFESIIDKIGKGYKKSPVLACVDLREDEAVVHILDSEYRSVDMLIISGGVGSGWVKNTFVSDINFRFGLGFSRKGMMKNIYAIDWNMMYDFSESNENKYFELNHFISAGWEHNFSNSPLEDKWYGFSFGYLVKRNNDFFKENTFRISVKKKINDTISLKPELYFNDFFKNIYPGIRVSVSF